MTFHRLKLGLKNLGRIVEIWHCFTLSMAPFRELLAYLQLVDLEYPYKLYLKNGAYLLLHDWQDLTTAWVVFYGKEYTLSADDQIVIDCGANIGAFTLFCAKYLPRAHIIAVEPFPANYRRLELTIQENALIDFVTPVNAAVVGREGCIFMDDAIEIASHSRKIGGDKGVKVQGLTLEKIMNTYNIKEASFLKVDIEGAEYPLFAETPKEVLRRCQRIGLEYHGNGDTQALFKHLKEAGFKQGRYPKKGAAGVVEFIRI